LTLLLVPFKPSPLFRLLCLTFNLCVSPSASCPSGSYRPVFSLCLPGLCLSTYISSSLSISSPLSPLFYRSSSCVFYSSLCLFSTPLFSPFIYPLCLYSFTIPFRLFLFLPPPPVSSPLHDSPFISLAFSSPLSLLLPLFSVYFLPFCLLPALCLLLCVPLSPPLYFTSSFYYTLSIPPMLPPFCLSVRSFPNCISSFACFTPTLPLPICFFLSVSPLCFFSLHLSASFLLPPSSPASVSSLFCSVSYNLSPSYHLR
jgi:hypothetical protein